MFLGKPPEPGELLKDFDKPKPDPAYLNFVKQMPCCICGRPGPSDAHHPICERWSQEKAPDRDAIPLCKKHHQWGPDAIHNGKESWVAKYGSDRDYIAGTQDAVERMKNG